MIKLPSEVQEVLNEYEAAMFASNEAGYAGITAEQTIRFLMERAEAAEAELNRLNATAQPVSDDKSSLLTYLNECSEQVNRWPEWKNKGSDVTKLIKEMDDFELGFVNGWAERHKQPVSDGFTLMPKELTLEMAKAAAPYHTDCKQYYRALVAAGSRGDKK